MSTQTTGLVLAAVGVTLLWSAWALVVAGVLLVAVPELASGVRYLQARSRFRAAATRGEAPAVLPS